MAFTREEDRQLLVIGAGGHAKVVIDVARAAGWSPVAALDPSSVGEICNDVPVVGGDDMAQELYAKGVRRAVVAIGLNALRLKIGEGLQSLGFDCPAVVHPSAVVSPSARLDQGVVVMPQAVVNAAATVEAFAIVNTGAIVEHDCTVGAGAHMAPRSVIGGTVSVGRLALFGIGAVARPNSTIGDRAVVGAGSVVVGSIGDDALVMGAPAREKRSVAGVQ